MFILSEEQFKQILVAGGFKINSCESEDNELIILGKYSSICERMPH